MQIVGALLKQFGSGVAGLPPSVPSLSVTDNSNLSVSVSISGSSVGSSNSIYLSSVLDPDWYLSGTRTSDGTVDISLNSGGKYFIYATSSINSQFVVSDVGTFWVMGDGQVGTLGNSPAEILRALLIDLGVGCLPSDELEWPIGVYEEIPTPDNTITIYDTSGNLDGRIQSNGVYHEQYGIMVRVRGTKSPVGNLKARQISEVFDKSIRNNTVSIESNQYLVTTVNRKGGVMSLGWESPTSRRSLFTLNALMNVQQLD